METFKLFSTFLYIWITFTCYGAESQNLHRINEVFQAILNPYRVLQPRTSVQHRRHSKAIEPLHPDLIRSSLNFLSTDCTVDYNPDRIEELPEDERQSFAMFLQCPPGQFVVSSFHN